MLWVGEGDETKTPGSLSLPVFDNDHFRNRTEAAEVVFQSLLIGVEIEPSHEKLPFFRRHGSQFGYYGEYEKKVGETVDMGRKKTENKKGRGKKRGQ